MTDYNPLNPSQSGKIHFNTQKQGKNAQPQDAEAEEPLSAVDPYAGERMEPGEVLAQMLAQSKGVFNPQQASIQHHMLNFGQLITPAKHAETTLALKNAYINEFGKSPSDALLQAMVDRALIGEPQIQTA